MSQFTNDGTVQGTIHLIEETKTFGQKGFRKRLVVLEQPGERFTNFVPVEFTQDNCDSVDGLSEGESIEVKFRISGRKWQRDPQSEVKYFSNVEAISFKVLGGSSSGDTEAANDEFNQVAYEDDIPF